jgi:SAM-dependent methyltransferase
MHEQRRRVREAWDAVADDYARMRNPDGPDAALLTELVDDLPAEARVLDIGCGDGARTLANLPDGTVGLDFSRVQLDLARDRVSGAGLLQGDMTALPIATDSVDAVTAYHAVFHVPRAEHPGVYAEFARVLRPGGRLLMTVGRGSSDSTARNWLDSGETMYWSTPGRDATVAQLRDAGFTVEWERLVDDPLGSEALFVLAALPA